MKQIATWQAVVETLAKRFYVSGDVQGVGFRFFAEGVAAFREKRKAKFTGR